MIRALLFAALFWIAALPASATTTFLTSGTSFTVPTGVTNITTAECIGPGSDGANDNGSTLGGGGGGGGGYGLKNNITVTPGGSETIAVGIHNSSTATTFHNATTCKGANAAPIGGTTTGTGGAGGTANAGDTTFNGGAGANQVSTTGGGGGGAAGLNGAGAAASGTTGGTGDNGHGGAGGAAQVAGGDGTEYDASHGSGGGGGGDTGTIGGGAGGSFGAGGGGASLALESPGVGKGGLIVLNYSAATSGGMLLRGVGQLSPTDILARKWLWGTAANDNRFRMTGTD